MLDFFNNFLGFIGNVFNRLMNISYDGILVFAVLASFGILVFAFEGIIDILSGG